MIPTSWQSSLGWYTSRRLYSVLQSTAVPLRLGRGTKDKEIPTVDDDAASRSTSAADASTSSFASASPSSRGMPWGRRETAFQRQAARQRFQQAFWTLVEDRRTCYRDDVIWNKLHPYRCALTEALYADVGILHGGLFPRSPGAVDEDNIHTSTLSVSSPKCPDDTLSHSSISSSTATVPGSLLMHQLDPSSSAVAYQGREEDEKKEEKHTHIPQEKGRVWTLSQVICIAKDLPNSVKKKGIEWETNLLTDRKQTAEHLGEREMFVLDVILSTVLQSPDELTFFLKSVLAFPSTSSSSLPPECRESVGNEVVSGREAQEGMIRMEKSDLSMTTTSSSRNIPSACNHSTAAAVSAATAAAPSHSFFAPPVYAAILQSLLWLGSSGPTSCLMQSSCHTEEYGKKIHLDRERIGKLAGRYMGIALNAFRHRQYDSITGEEEQEWDEEKKNGTLPNTKSPSLLSSRAHEMDVVWNSFFVVACLAQMKTKLLDLWWNHLCVFYKEHASRSLHGSGVIERDMLKSREAEDGEVDSEEKEEEETLQNAKWEQHMAHTGNTCEVEVMGTKKKEEHPNEKETSMPSWLDLMSTMEEVEEAAEAREIMTKAHNEEGDGILSPSSLSPQTAKRRKDWCPLPYEAVLGLMAATADNSDIERTVNIFHDVMKRGLHVSSPLCFFSSPFSNCFPSPCRFHDSHHNYPSSVRAASSSCSWSSFIDILGDGKQVSRPRHDAASSSSCCSPLLRQNVQLRCFAKLLASTKFSNNEDGGLRAIVVKDIQRYISPSVLLDAPWEVLNDLFIGLSVSSAMQLVKVRSTRSSGGDEGVVVAGSTTTSSCPSSPNVGLPSASSSGKAGEIKKQGKVQDEGEKEVRPPVLWNTKKREEEKEHSGVPFFIWASLLRRCARDHLIEEAEALFRFIRVSCSCISGEEKKELVSIMIRMYATLSPPDASDALHLFVEHILRDDQLAASFVNWKRNAPTGTPSNNRSTRKEKCSISNEGVCEGRQDEEKGENASKQEEEGHPTSNTAKEKERSTHHSSAADDTLYSLLIRSADSRNASMMYFLEACADGMTLSVELFESLFGSHSHQTSLRSLQKRLPHDYTSSKLDSLIRIPTNIDAHLRREEAQREAGQPVVDSTGEGY